MKSPIISPAGTFAKIMLLAAAIFGVGMAIRLAPSKAAFKAGSSSGTTGACSIIVTPSSISAPSGGGDFQVGVSNLQLCQWLATPSVSWIDVSLNTSALPFVFVTVSVDPNVGPARSGTVNIGGTI